jgi:DNA-binding CsgD family transcriptional regulator
MRQMTQAPKAATMRRMTDAESSPSSSAERLTLTGLLAAIAVLMTIDAAGDWWAGGSTEHVVLELVVAAAAGFGVALLWARYLRLRSTLATTEATLAAARAEAERWREHNADTLRGLSSAIDRQLEAWRLSPSEKEVAFLLLKGLSLKEVATARGTSERTVRKQALAVYAKSGVGGRAELSAFFLEDLLVPS